MPLWKRLIALLIFALIYWALSEGAFWYPKRRVPITGRWQYLYKSKNAEYYTELFKKFCAHEDARGKLVRQGPQYESVMRVKDQLLAVASSDAPQCKFEFVVRERLTKPGMRCVPGGKIYVDTGFLGLLESDGELALLLGHEMAHAVAMHHFEISLRSTLGKLISPLQVPSLPLSPLGKFLKALLGGLIRHYYVELGYSRKQELEADRIGLTYALKAGYNVQKAILVWTRLSRQLPKVWEPGSTHPSHEKRLRSLQKWLEETQAVAA